MFLGPAASEPRGYRSGSPRQRAVSATLSAAVVLLALLFALYQTQIAPHLDQPQTVTSFDVPGEKDDDEGDEAQDKEKSEEKEKAPETKQREPSPDPKPVETPQVEPPKAQKQAFTFMKLSSADMAAADIGRMSGPAPAQSPAGSGSVYGPGEGPGGAVLYNADWYRPPTDAELAGYLPARRPDTGWGMIACQTIEQYRVENCQILGESPRGSGFGRAVLEAAWQFRVQPPRINGKPQLGTWVRIRIDYGTRRSG
ncbi:energy transducer TonB [Novosphingobium sp. YJ-S2-02]|uniref:Energy transducer TonB n=1 Tax=Novosphingobium aureum TaxID=2792964 RepID=A0A931HB85_9SPHN|nr:energy transducer TonB [Novosphingobium aureum]MBH0112771.1 energy transducer TonB [Novosphingobium aureum]